GRLHFLVCPDVNSVTLLFPSASLVDGLEDRDGASELAPNRVVCWDIVCVSNFENRTDFVNWLQWLKTHLQDSINDKLQRRTVIRVVSEQCFLRRPLARLFPFMPPTNCAQTR